MREAVKRVVDTRGHRFRVLVGAEQFLHEQRGGPAVQHRVVRGEDEDAGRVIHQCHGQPDQRGGLAATTLARTGFEIKSPGAVLIGESLQVAIRVVTGTQIDNGHRLVHGRGHHRNRCPVVAGPHGHPQLRVLCRHGQPRVLQPLLRKRADHVPDVLRDIQVHTAVTHTQLRMEQHSALRRGQGVDVSQFSELVFPLPDGGRRDVHERKVARRVREDGPGAGACLASADSASTHNSASSCTASSSMTVCTYATSATSRTPVSETIDRAVMSTIAGAGASSAT